MWLSLVALLLRLPLMAIGIARDEGSTYLNTLPDDLPGVADRVASCELNPPGYFVLTRWCLDALGTTEWTLKLPALVCGVLLVGATYALGRQVGSSRVAFTAAFLMTFSPEAIYFSQEARPYTLASLLLCVCVGAFWKRSFPVLALAGAAFLYVQYTGFALLGALCLAGMLRPPRLWTWLVVASALLLFLPWAPVFAVHLHTGVPWADPVPFVNRIWTLLDALMKVLPLAPVAGYVALAAGLLLTRDLPGEHTRSLRVVLLIYVGGLSALAMADNYVHPAQPLAAILLALLFDKHARWRRALLVVSVLGGLIYVGYHTRAEKSGVRTALDIIARVPRTLVVVSPDYFGPTAAFYMRDLGLTLRGFARWDQPELFRPADYAEVWNEPALLNTWWGKFAAELPRFEHVALISNAEPLRDSGRMRYSRADELRTELNKGLLLMQSSELAGQQEHVRLDLYRVALAPSSRSDARHQGRSNR